MMMIDEYDDNGIDEDDDDEKWWWKMMMMEEEEEELLTYLRSQWASLLTREAVSCDKLTEIWAKHFGSKTI